MAISEGVIYQATGMRKYLASCACSIQSLRWAGYTGPVRVLVDTHDIPASLFDGLEVELEYIETPGTDKTKKRISARSIKTRLPDYTPWERSIYLDCDVVILNDINTIWQALGDADLGMVRCVLPVEQTVHGHKEEVSYMRQLNITGPQWNGGVMVWRNNPSTRRLFEAWHSEWQRFGHIDQLALVRALRDNPVAFQELPERYNCLRDGQTLPMQRQGVVLWHLVGGHYVQKFREIFGDLYDGHCRALKLKKSEMDTPYHATLRRRLRFYIAYWSAREKYVRIKKRGAKVLTRR